MAKSEDMWTQFKELQHVVQAVVSRPVQGVIKQMEVILQKHKQNFITLLKNPLRPFFCSHTKTLIHNP
jgi:hypothetical protein